MKPHVASSRPGRRASVRKRLSSSYAFWYQRSSWRCRCSVSSSRFAFGSTPRSLAMAHDSLGARPEGGRSDRQTRAGVSESLMPIKGIDHWVIVVNDLERTLDFYRRLGFAIAYEQRPGRPDMPTIRIGDAQKINVHAREWPERPQYLG